MRRLLLAAVLGVLTAAWEIGGRSFFPFLQGLHLLIPGIILMIVSSAHVSRAMAFGLSGAVLLDVFALQASDFAVLRIILIILFIDAVSRSLLTNRSLYAALGLGLLARGIDLGSAWFVLQLHLWLGSAPLFFSVWRGWSIFVWDGICIFVGFILVARVTKRFSTRGRTSLYEPSA